MIQAIKKYIQSNMLLCLGAIVFLLSRLVLLDQLFLLHDERDIVFSGYAIARSAHDIFGNILPLSFGGISPDNPLVSIYYSAMWWIIMPIRSVFIARLPFVLVSTVLIFLVYEIVNHLSNNRKTSLVTSVIFAFSPWVFHVTRLALDLPLAAVTLFGGILLFLKDKRWYAYFLFFLTFYNYQGFRVVIPFLIIYLEFIKAEVPVYTFAKTFLQKNVYNIIFIVFLFLSVIFVDKSVTTKRFSQVAFLSPTRFTTEVNTRRAASNAPLIIRDAFHNKFSVAADYIIDNFVKGQDISYLFKTGDYSPINGNAAGGQFFFIFLLFYYLGIMALGRRMERKDFYIVGFVFLGLLPAMVSVNSTTYSIRGFLSTIGYAYLLALGVGLAMDAIKKSAPRYRNVLVLVGFVVVVINLTYFLYNYYERRQVTVGELFNENERQLSNYLLNHPDKRYIIYHNDPKNLYMSYLFMNNEVAIPHINPHDEKINTFQTHNETFLKCPTTPVDFMKLKGVIISETCLKLKTHDELNKPQYGLVKIPYKDLSLKTAYFIFE